MKVLSMRIRIGFSLGRGLLAVALLTALPVGRAAGAEVGDVFVIALENHNFTQPAHIKNPRRRQPQQLLGNPACPFINSLVTPGDPHAKYVSYCSHYSNAGNQVHPSEASLIWAECGTNFNPSSNVVVHNDADPSQDAGNVFTLSHLTGLMDAAHLRWKDYQEDVQISGEGEEFSSHGELPDGVTNPYNGTHLYDYACKHNPMCFFADTANRNVYPISQLERDLIDNMVGRYNWITPDQYNEMHTPLPDGYTYHGVHYTGDQSAIASGDHCLSVLIPLIEASWAFRNNGVIIIWTDETEGGDTADFALPELVISPLCKGNAYNSKVPVNRSSDLKTMQEIFKLGPYLNPRIPADEYGIDGPGHLNNVPDVNDLSDLFVPGTIPNGVSK
ncbi:MAG TPA: alkaline phosphatase family protein [Tepidisphaeraceae bacterium]|nr:alkaline phosphatase family protein [Tepidisphaeraceae bacterium]